MSPKDRVPAAQAGPAGPADPEEDGPAAPSRAEPTRLRRNSYAVFCLKKKNKTKQENRARIKRWRCTIAAWRGPRCFVRDSNP